MKSVIVVGIGQSLRGDDAVGLEAVRGWQQAYPASTYAPNVEVELSELPGLGLIDLIADHDVAILVDAVRSGAPGGTLHLLQADSAQAFAAGSGSAHGWGVAETLGLAQKISPDRLPPHLVLIGVEAEQIELGRGLSPAVESALPAAGQMIDRQVRWFAQNSSQASAGRASQPAYLLR
jgi:hydrogenase maturation protease